MIADRYADYMHGLIARIISEVGPREACSPAEEKAGDLFAAEIAPVCDTVEKEGFSCSPRAVFYTFPALAVIYLAGVALYYVLPPLTIALMLLAFALLLLEVVRIREVIDRLLPAKQGYNVAGIVRPSGEVRKRVVFSAHLDSAFEYKVWYWFKNGAIAIMGLQILAFLVLLGASLARTIAGSRGIPHGASAVLGIICIAMAPVVALLFVFRTGDMVPGAMDDLAGVSVMAGLAKYLREARQSGTFYPRNTEVVLLGMSSEEAGLRGAKRYVTAHEAEMKAIPTYGIFWDGIYDEKYLFVNRREIFPGARHDPYLVGLAGEVARSEGFEVKTGFIPMGASDGAEFSRAGIPAVHICCQDTTRLVPNYHTRLDTVETVRPESLAVCLQISIDMLAGIDGA